MYIQNNEFFDVSFSLTEFNIALDTCKANSAPGMDRMSNEILSNLSHNYKLILLNIFNELFISSNYPAAWLDSFIYFIKKSDGKSMRPIALTPCSSIPRYSFLSLTVHITLNLPCVRKTTQL